MIAKGVTHAQGARLARYLITGKDRERAELLELRGFALTDIVDAFRSVQVAARATKCVLPFFHVSVRNPQGEKLDATQWTRTADAIEQSLGLADQPRAIAFHICEEAGESHMHVAWSRIHHDSLTAKPLPFFKERLKRICRELEAQFGLSTVPNTRTGRIDFAPTRKEEEQSRRLGLNLRDQRETIRECFERSDCGRSFQRALEQWGIVLSRGERRDFIAIDRAGGIHALGKRILGMSAAQVRIRFADLARDDLPTVQDVRQSLRAKPTERDALREPIAKPPAIVEVPELERFGPSALPTGEGEVAFLRHAEPHSEIDFSASRERSCVPVNALKLKFRAAVKASFKRCSLPQPRRGRRKTGDAVGAFRLVAYQVVRRIVHALVSAPVVAIYPPELWQWNNPEVMFQGTEYAQNPEHYHHPSLHL